MSSKTELLDTNVCRICTGKTDLLCFYKIILDEEYSYLHEAYTDILGLPISENDGLPQKLCVTCVTRLSATYLLKQKATRTLNKYLEQCENEPFIKNKQETTTFEIEIINENTSEGENSQPPMDAVEFMIETNNILSAQKPQSKKRQNLVERKHECQVCNKKFLKKSNLVDHLRMHANVRLYKCEFCDKAFIQSGNYKSHVRTHTKEKPFTCHFCLKSFSQSSALKTHIRTHTNEKNYICDVCSKAFTNSSDLSKHKRVHDPEKQMKCSYCDRLFAQKSNLKMHEKNYHLKSKEKESSS